MATFATETGTPGTSYAVSLGDLNNDGILDLVTASYVTNGSIQGQASRLLGTSRSGVAPILPFSLKTQTGAKAALNLMTSKLNLLSSQSGTIGVNQSRVGIAISNLSSTTENYQAASSRITDTDIAEESADLVRQQF